MCKSQPRFKDQKMKTLNFNIGDDVTVTEPKHDSSTHNYPFSGTIIDIVGESFLVEDQDSDIFTVELDELELDN